MIVPVNLAQEIVDRMKEIINQDINYIDPNCIIIASTDRKRIGDFHGGAQVVLKKKGMVAITDENQFIGTRKGINLPVYFDDNIVGIIGITGKEEEVSKYGKIIQSMTEILIKEAFIKEQSKIERESKKQFIEEVLFRINDEDKETIRIRSELLNVKLDIPRVTLVARVQQVKKRKMIDTAVNNYHIYNFINRYIDYDQQNLLVQSGLNYIMILNMNTTNDLIGLVKKIYENLKHEYNLSICFGIGSESRDDAGIRQSFEEAKKSLMVSLLYKKRFYVSIFDLDLELVVNDLSEKAKYNYLFKVFKYLDEEQLSSYIEVLSTYFRNNGSIMKTADELFLHKNTLQYKLNKIKTVTGYDPRNTRDLVVLYLAVLIYKSEGAYKTFML
ncbi:carbohydrate diacid regulator [Bacillus oleivorans]|uniref:Carbohydrate diacid regulator n=1 Tax=Bacillus oleivorans TaxID=1448271 RepID=A0A285CHM3_9BACI|nr:sugar diacid recognition domain-containing protein [Bacillus oleivorans]SNX67102.1 carbohydrate diacid regulator [Bacillus oleivorans]